MRPYQFAQPSENARVQKQSTRSLAMWQSIAARLVAVLVAGSGILNLRSLMGGAASISNSYWLRDVFPLDFESGAHTVTLISGFALILVAAHLWTFKRRAWQVTLLLAATSAVVHFQSGKNFEEAICSTFLLVALWLTRRSFVMGSQRPQLVTAAFRAAYAFIIAAAYGSIGFWLLEPAQFHRNFRWWDAGFRTIRLMLFLGDQTLLPHTPYAAWFLDSLFWMSAAAFLYSGFVLFHPVVYRFQSSGSDTQLAHSIAEKHGRTGQDFFKQWPDKSYFFSSNRRSFLGYRVAGRFALVLGDPVGPRNELQSTICQFITFCQRRGWRVGFHQVSADCLPVYETLGFHRFKVGDDAIVDLSQFSLAGSAMKEFRNTVNRLDRLGYRVERLDPPVPSLLLGELKRISDLWLAIPGHRERQFTLGRFEPWYVEATPVYIVFDPENKAVAFLNLVPSYDPELATVDLMRRGPANINGLMDYLFAKVFLDLKRRGIRYFSLGMAPLGDIHDRDSINVDERIVYWLMKKMPFIFRSDSLRRFKAKYADCWKPRYAVYQNRLDLPRLGLALRRICELPSESLGKAA